MNLQAVYTKRKLKFRFEAGTSRGVLTEKDSYFIKIFDSNNPEIYGLGEASPLIGLSIDADNNFENNLKGICSVFNKLDLEVFAWNLNIIINQLISDKLPAIKFGFETALLDFMNDGKRIIFRNDFQKGILKIPINGLIWMNNRGQMEKQIQEKIEAGYTTLKIKIGALNFIEELACIAKIREVFSENKITLRLDANGAFSPQNVNEVLAQLSPYKIQSIEQPIAAGQGDALSEICKNSPIPIALDEELIGIPDYFKKMALLKKIKPQYIILKPTLLGGMQHCREWIEIANRMHIGWWLTSALESNIGLNAIAQFAAEYKNTLPQGLGTGQLFDNNIDSPLYHQNGYLSYNNAATWGDL